MKEKIYYYNGELNPGKIVTISGEEFHHLSVMRTRANDKICLINGDRHFYLGNVISIDKKSASVLVESKCMSENEPKINLTIYQALAKGDKLSLITQKISEIGASSLKLFESKFTDIKGEQYNASRLKSIAISASKQCERASILQVDGTFTLGEVAKQIGDYDAFYVAYENHDGRSLYNEICQKNISSVALMIGAEGGFSSDEIELLEKSGATIVTLGKRILRTETASIVGAGLIMQVLEK